MNNTYTLFDRIINLYFYARKADGTIDSTVVGCSLTCPNYGPKPAISISYKQTEGVTYQIIIKVSNFIPTINMLKYNAIRITAGYSSATSVNHNIQVTSTLTMAITNSFTEQPMPNGIWQVNGIISDWFAYMEPKNAEGQVTCYDIKFNTDTITIGELINQIVTRLGVQAHYDANASWLKYQLTPQYKHYRGTSYWATLRWLVEQLNQFSKAYLNPDKQMICNTFDDAQGKVQLYIWKSGDQNYADSGEPVTKIRLINSFQLLGPKAQITMPYYPTVVPGSLIQITPEYYTSQVEPKDANEAAVDTTKAATPHIFRVLLSSVSFSTVGSTNQMTIEAIPAAYYTSNHDVNVLNLTTDYTADEKNAQTVAQTEEINIGNSEIDDSDARTMIQNLAVTAGDHFTGTSADGLYYTIKSGDTLSSLAKAFYGSKIQAINYTRYPRTDKIYTKNVVVDGEWPSNLKTALAAVPYDTRTTSAYASALWPLIVLGTYVVARREANAKHSTTKETMSKLGYCTSILKNPDIVEVGKKVWIYTRFTSPDDIKWASTIFSTMATFYTEHQDTTHTWRSDLEINGLKAIAAFMDMDNLPIPSD